MGAGEYYTIMEGGGYDSPLWVDIVMWTIMITLCVVLPIVALIINKRNDGT